MASLRQTSKSRGKWGHKKAKCFHIFSLLDIVPQVNLNSVLQVILVTQTDSNPRTNCFPPGANPSISVKLEKYNSNKTTQWCVERNTSNTLLPPTPKIPGKMGCFCNCNLVWNGAWVWFSHQNQWNNGVYDRRSFGSTLWIYIKKLSEAESGKGLKGRSQRTSGEPLAENVIRQLLFWFKQKAFVTKSFSEDKLFLHGLWNQFLSKNNLEQHIIDIRNRHLQHEQCSNYD